MSAEACTLALKNTLNEIRNVCPDIHHAFVFRGNGEILAEDDSTTEVAVNNAQEAFRALAERAAAAGGVDQVSLRCAGAKVSIIRFDDLFVTTVSSNEADERTVSNLTRIMIPTTLKLVQNILPTIKTQPAQAPVSLPQATGEPQVAELVVQASEFTVENLTGFGGFLNDPETAYVDSALLVQWAEAFGDRPVKLITLESPATGKTTQCKYRPFKDAKYENRGIVQLPELIQTSLRIARGAQVLIKPVVEALPVEEETNASAASESGAKVAETLKSDLFSESNVHTGSVPTTQFMVENLRGLGGLLGSPTDARVDTAIIARWTEMFGDRQIKEITVEETVFGKKIQCRFQPIKDSHLEGKGVIQLPEKIQQALRTKKGALVLVKPVVE